MQVGRIALSQRRAAMVDHPAVGSTVIVLPVWFRLCRLRMKRTALNKERGEAFGTWALFVAARRPGAARGQVARGTFSGPRSRGTRWGPRRAAPSTPSRRATSHDTANGASARTPNHLPRHRTGTPARGGPPSVAAGRWWCPRAEAPFAVSWLCARLDRDDVAGRCGPGWRPASVGRRTGAPPPPWGAVAGGLGLHGHTGFGGSAGPPALARTLACAQARTPTLRRKLVLPSAGPFHASRVARSAVEQLT